MREVTFLKQNADIWKGFEKNLESGHANPDLLADQFIRISDDLSYAKTFYPESNTTKYLNELATKVHLKIYKNKKERSGRFFTFWKYDVPMAAYQARKPILYSFIITMVAVLIGVVSEYYNDDFVRYLLGDTYVNQTLENIKKQDPMGVYKEGPALYSFLSIAINNVKVTIIAYVMGIFVSVGTVRFLFINGMMIGLFECLMYKQGYLWTSLSVILLHGTLEISAIIIGGGAGLMLGNSILFPGTYTRVQSLMNGAKTGMVIVMGLVPVFILAAFFEGFVSRHSDLHISLKLLIILSSLAFIIYYFIIYPNKLYKQEHAGK
jgi:uncharacterized membrane protein SpoIIM required for sporulation